MQRPEAEVPEHHTYVSLDDGDAPENEQDRQPEMNEMEQTTIALEAEHRFWSLQLAGMGTLAAFAFLWLIIYIVLNVTALLLYPFYFLPLLLCFGWSYRYHSNITTIGDLLLKFGSGFICLAFVFVMQLVLALGLIMIAWAFRASGSRASHIFHLLSVLYLCVVAVPIPEGFVLLQVTIQRTHRHNKSFIINALYTNLGYATAQAMMVTLIGQLPKSTDDFSAFTWGTLLLYSLVYFLWCGPMQMLAGYLQGLVIAEAQEKQLPTPILRAQVLPWAFRSTYYLLFTIPALVSSYLQLPGYTPLAVFFVGTALLFAGFIAFVKHVERQLPPSYLARVGYLNAFGYGLLPQVEELNSQDKEMTEVA